MKAILFIVVFVVVKFVYVSVLKFLMLSWFTVTTRFMENVLSKTPNGADDAILWGRILGFVSHPMLWFVILMVNYGYG